MTNDTKRKQREGGMSTHYPGTTVFNRWLVEDNTKNNIMATYFESIKKLLELTAKDG